MLDRCRLLELSAWTKSRTAQARTCTAAEWG